MRREVFGGSLDVEVEKIEGGRGIGHYRLQVHLKLSGNNLPDCTVVELHGSILISQGGHLGDLRPANPPVDLRGPFFPPATLVMDLDHRRLEGLEALRGGEGVDLSINISGRVAAGEKSATFHLQERYPINQGTWVEILGHMGYADILLLEVPVPQKQDAPALAGAIEHLRSAVKFVQGGDNRTAVGTCRKALEALAEARGDANSSVLKNPDLFVRTRDMDKADRLRVVRYALKVFTHPAMHADEVSAEISYDRDDAVRMVAMLAALLRSPG